MFGRGAGVSGRGFDARQKIGANDVRQRIGLGAGKSMTMSEINMILYY